MRGGLMKRGTKIFYLTGITLCMMTSCLSMDDENAFKLLARRALSGTSSDPEYKEAERVFGHQELSKDSLIEESVLKEFNCSVDACNELWSELSKIRALDVRYESMYLKYDALLGHIKRFIKSFLYESDLDISSYNLIYELVNTEDSNGWLPLCKTVASGNIKLARILLDFGALPNKVGRGIGAAVHWAAVNGNVAIVRLLTFYRANWISVRNSESQTPTDLILKYNRLDVLRVLTS
jgi:hypothetical protein